MKKNAIITLAGIAIVAAAGIFAFSACDQKTTAPSVENSDVREINVSDDLRNSGLRIDRVLLASGKSSATVYARYEKPFSAGVILAAFDRTGNEIGRSKRTVSGNVDDAGYVDFDFDTRVPMKSASYFRLSRATDIASVPVTSAEPATTAEVATAQPDVLPEIDEAQTPETTPPLAQ